MCQHCTNTQQVEHHTGDSLVFVTVVIGMIAVTILMLIENWEVVCK